MLETSEKLNTIAARVERELASVFERFDKAARCNTQRVLSAFSKNRVSDTHFNMATGYGYSDVGRDTLDRVFADIVGAEDAVFRINLVSGTHAIACALFAALNPGEKLLAAVGAPYDTLHGVIGISGDYPGSLAKYGIGYLQAGLGMNGLPDIGRVAELAREPDVGAVLIQRSRGYSGRRSLSVAQIGELIEVIRKANPAARIIVDNCYGEFVETSEPISVGADLIAGSLIKNPGGGLAPTGGYIAGRSDLVDAAAMRMTAPGIGRHCGCSLGNNRLLYQGLFMAPHTVAQALKTAAFCAGIMRELGFDVSPAPLDDRFDIVQSIDFVSPAPLLEFCKGIQAGAPVDSFAVPEPWDMPGYDCQVVMAAGAFVQGASIELSCDAPMRPPYTAYMQGGLTFESGRAGVLEAAARVLSARGEP